MNNNTTQSIEVLTMQYRPLVERIATSLRQRLPQWVERDTLVQAGMLGLVQAAHSFKPSKGADFGHYAGHRIHGEMLDALRAEDYASRSSRRWERRIKQAREHFATYYGRQGDVQEIAATMGISLSEFYRGEQRADLAHVLHFADLHHEDDKSCDDAPLREQPAPDFANPALCVEHAETMRQLWAAVAALPDPRERDVIIRTFVEEHTLQEIGDSWSVTEARVCQIRNRALQNLRARLGALVDDLSVATPTPARNARRETGTARRTTPRARVHRLPTKKKALRHQSFEFAKAA